MNKKTRCRIKYISFLHRQNQITDNEKIAVLMSKFLKIDFIQEAGFKL